MLTFVDKHVLTSRRTIAEIQSKLKHRHFRLDALISDLRLPAREVYKMATRLLDKKVDRASDILKLSLSEHDRLERFIRKKYKV